MRRTPRELDIDCYRTYFRKGGVMQFIPDLQLGWMNGWVLLAFFYMLFGLFLLSCPKPIVKKLYNVKGWSKRVYILSAI